MIPWYQVWNVAGMPMDGTDNFRCLWPLSYSAQVSLIQKINTIQMKACG